jgi:tight adherence protein B
VRALGAARARDAVARDLPEAARAIARASSAGLPLVDAIERSAEAVDAEAAALLREAARRLRAGQPIGAALVDVADVPGGRVLVGAIELHEEIGGDLVASLGAIAEGLADRERLRLEARAMTAQARIAARVVPLAPCASLLVLAVLTPEALRELVTTVPGLAILGASAGLTGVALLLLRRIAAEAIA